MSTSSLLKPMYPHISGLSRTNRIRALVALPTQATLAPLPSLTPLPQAIKNTLRRLYYLCHPAEIRCFNLQARAPLEHCQPAETHSLNPLPCRMNQPTHVKTSHTPLLTAPPTTANALRSHSDPTVFNSETLPGYSIY